MRRVLDWFLAPSRRQVLIAVLVLVLIVGPAIIHQYYPEEHVALLYAVPILVAGLTLSPGLALAFIALALVGHTLDAIRDQASLLLWGTQALVLLIVAYLAIRARQQVLAETRLSAQLRQERQEREQFTGAVIHEIRNVLTIILGYAAVLARSERGRSEAEQQALMSIEAQSQRLNRLVQDLQTVSRIERGVFGIVRGACDLRAVTEQVVHDEQMLTQRHELHLTIRADSTRGYWDCGRLRQVIANLVRNAIRYSPAGGRVDVELARVNGAVRLAVTDQGIGMSPQEQAQLFRPYVRLRPEIDREGLGIGLFISKQIVEEHGGRIWVESQPGKGSTFTFEVPISAPAERNGRGRPAA